jgi:diketogulonate reductase-like aldo/keto reductase
LETDAFAPYQGFVAIPKSVSQARIQENAQIFDFELDAEDMEQVRQTFPQSFGAVLIVFVDGWP